MTNRRVIRLLLPVWIAVLPAVVHAADPALVCERIAGKSLLSCVKQVGKRLGKCYATSGAACAAGDAKIDKALDKLAEKLAKRCPSDAVVQAAGFGPLMTVAGLTARLQSQCRADAAALAARAFGGPHAAILAGSDAAGRTCLVRLYDQGLKLLTGRAKAQNACVDSQRRKGACNTDKTAAKIAKVEAKALAKIEAACGTSDDVATRIGIDTPEYLERAAAQARCLTAMAHPDPAPLALDCGPRDEVVATPRGTYVQVVLDEAASGAVCGDGSPYAFWIRLAPSGEPVENVVLQMQGGGLCVFETHCDTLPDEQFEALGDVAEQTGIMSNDPVVSPFANWTKVYLPYCTQDLFAGGGLAEFAPPATVRRAGALNVRAALRYVRDVIWRELDATTAEGYHPDRIRMLFGGSEAGGSGALYHYHYVLDDLQWAHTAAWADSALALNDSQPVGIGLLPQVFDMWGARPYFAPYAFFAVGPSIYAAMAPRLEAVPEQRFLVLANQVYHPHESVFPTLTSFINAVRHYYCATAGTTGLRYFLPARTPVTPALATDEALYTTQTVDGIVLRDWLAQAMAAPETLPDAVEEGTLVADYPGVNPFPCVID